MRISSRLLGALEAEGLLVMENYKEDYIGILDALRGLMALWVFFGHLEWACIRKSPPWGTPLYAVFVFMLLSGFLMAYHWHMRREKFANFHSQTKDFYVRRFFRIAPLYYVLLTIALLWQPQYGAAYKFVDSAVSPTGSVSTSAHHSVSNYARTLPSILSHYTFLFGFIPQYADNNALPDWSIGLEMQFYLIFPFLMIALFRYGPFSVAMASVIIAVLTNKLVGLNDVQGRLGTYPMPSLILFEINIFLAGMCLAFAYIYRDQRRCIYWLVAGGVALIHMVFQVKIFAFIIIFLLMFDVDRRELLTRSATSRVARFLADTSYSVYLLHFLILWPVLYLLFHQAWFVHLGPYSKVGISFALISIPVYGVSYLLFKFIELPGIKLGRNILQVVKPKRVVNVEEVRESVPVG